MGRRKASRLEPKDHSEAALNRKKANRQNPSNDATSNSEILSSRTPGQNVVLRMQQSLGNSYVRRFLEPDRSSLQRLSVAHSVDEDVNSLTNTMPSSSSGAANKDAGSAAGGGTDPKNVAGLGSGDLGKGFFALLGEIYQGKGTGGSAGAAGKADITIVDDAGKGADSKGTGANAGAAGKGANVVVGNTDKGTGSLAGADSKSAGDSAHSRGSHRQGHSAGSSGNTVKSGLPGHYKGFFTLPNEITHGKGIGSGSGSAPIENGWKQATATHNEKGEGSSHHADGKTDSSSTIVVLIPTAQGPIPIPYPVLPAEEDPKKKKDDEK